jgi:hypothetical protein
MQRLWAIAAIAAACTIAPPAVSAQQADPHATPNCPSESISIYFASGDAALTSEARQLVSRLAAQAVACQPDGIDLITIINTDIDGDHAVSLALARLDDVSRDLVSLGFPPGSIRVAARPGRDVFPAGMNEVEVIFRKNVPGAGEASTQQPAAPLRVSPGAI